MKFNRILFCLWPACSLLIWGCAKSGGSSSSGATCTASTYNPIDSGQVPNVALANVMPLTVNASNAAGAPSSPGAYCDPSCETATNPTLCAASSAYAGRPCLYSNEPTATVTVCQPGSTTACQTFSNLLVDTGSSGLRIFSNSLDNNGVPLLGNAGSVFPSAPAPSSALWDCEVYADGSSEWGQALPVDVWMGSGGPTSATPGEVAANVRMQVIQYDATGVGGSYCVAASGGTADTSAQEAGYTGILGVGLESYDCNLSVGCKGDVGCTAAQEAAGICLDSGYYQCTGAGGTSCTAVNPTSNSQLVQNPVTGLATDKNGVIMAFTANIGAGGSPSVSGYLTLGIGTKANNAVASQVTKYSVYPFNVANAQNGTALTFNTNFSSTSLSGFIDSGSNFYYFPAPSSGTLPICSDDPNQSFYCPASTQSFSAVNSGSDGSTSGCVDFQVANADNIYLNATTFNSAFINLGATSGVLQSGGSFDWGLPFFFGKSVYIGYDLPSASPYWAY